MSDPAPERPRVWPGAFAERLARAAGGRFVSVVPIASSSRVRTRAEATELWRDLRTRAEELIAEANAVLIELPGGDGGPTLSLLDELGGDVLGFVIGYDGRWARIRREVDGPTAHVGLERSSSPGPAGHVRLAGVAAVESIVLELVLAVPSAVGTKRTFARDDPHRRRTPAG